MTKLVILCVDDETIVLKSLRDQLKRRFGRDYVIEIAEGGEEALELIDEIEEEHTHRIFIVISDWLMPGMKGDEFLIRVHNKYPDAITVMLTGQADESAIANARKHARLYQCISKPWDEMHLVGVIEKCLEDVSPHKT